MRAPPRSRFRQGFASAAQSPRTRREESAGQRKLTQSWLSASYGKKGQVCELFISPQKPTTPIKSANQTKVIDSKLLTEIINELVPENERGRGISGDFLNIRCLPSDDCVGTGSNWENISIYRNGSSNDEHYATIQWRGADCASQTAE